MFEELFALAAHTALTMVVSANAKDGKLTIAVIPKPADDLGESALRRGLCLTATPQEFDAGFVDTLRNYREAWGSLAEQAAATNEVLQAAKAASVKKAGDAASKASKPASAPAKPPAAPQRTDADAGSQRSDAAPQAVPQQQPEVTDLFG